MIQFGLIGTSQISSKMAQALSYCKKTEAAAVYSRSEEKGRRFAETNQIPKIFTDFNDMLPHIDAVYIASPNSLHFEQSIWFLKRGIPVLCEKPLASNRMEVEQMLRTAEEHGTILVEAYKSRYMPAFETVRQLLPDIGTVRNITFSFSKYSSRYDAHKAGEPVNTFRAEYSNGALLDLGVYCLYPVLELFGRPDSCCSSAVSLSDGIDGAGSLILSYPDKIATLNYSKISNGYPSNEIQGEKGTITIDAISSPRTVTVRLTDGRTEIYTPPTFENDLVYECDFFADLLNSKKQPDAQRIRTAFTIMDHVRYENRIFYPADHL